MQPLLFNGKFLSAQPTGVHRVAEQMILAVDLLLAARGDFGRHQLLLPPDALRNLPLQAIRPRSIGRSTWQVWEQFDLPRLAGAGMLVNLCNLGPIARRNAVTMIHDAQVWDASASYSPQFRSYYRAMLPRIGHRHRSILTVSKFARTRLLHYRIAPAEAIHVIHNGVDHVRQVAPDRATARAKGLIPGRYVLALASTQSHKNIALLTRAFADPALADITLALVGGASVTRISPEASANVTSLGQVSDSALFGLMADALAWACPSLTEGFGLPPLEAMALGAPVIAAPRGALPEVLGAAPLWAAVDDPAEWVRHILHLATDQTEASRRSELGRRQAARFTWAAAGEALLTLLGSERHEAAPCAA